MDSDNFDYDTSENDSESYQKFVKRGNDDIKQKLVKPTKSVDIIERPKTSRGALGKGHFDQSNAFQKRPSTALDRFSALEAKIKQRQQTLKSTNYLSASSDYDIDVSSDYDVKQSIGKENVKLRNEIKPKTTIKSHGMNLNIADFSSSSSEDSSVKLRFLKKKSLPEDDSSTQDSYESKKKSTNQSQKKSVTKKVSFVSPDTSSVSLDHFIPHKSVSEDDISSLDDFAVSTNIHNVMSLDDLFVAEVASDIKNEESTPVKYSSDFEVSTEKFSNYSESETESSQSKGLMNIQGIEELQAFNAPQKDDDAKSSVVESIISEVEEYSEDFHEDDTLKETDSISVDSVHEEIEEIITDSTISEEISHKSSTNSTITDSSYSSSTITKYTSEFSYTETPQPTKIKTPQPKADMCTQTVNFDDTKTKESYSFVPSRLVKDEAIDILTTYNPATLAIQDLLKQQVNLTREFVSQSRRLHDLTNSSIPCDYVYGAIDISSLQRYRRLMNKSRYELEESP